jgi:hypothetical protein
VTENKPAVADARTGYAATIIGLMANQAVKTGGEVKIDPGALKV